MDDWKREHLKLLVWSLDAKRASSPLIHGPLSREGDKLEVKDVVTDLGWDWHQIQFDLPEEIKAMIQATPVSITNQGCDKLAWIGNPRESFDLKSAFSMTLIRCRVESLC